MKTVLHNARLLDPASAREGYGAVLIENGIISDIVWDQPAPASDTTVIECGGHLLCPGLTDLRAFMGEPGAEHRETLKTLSEAASHGGVTAALCMPETHPVMDDPAIIDFVLRRARDTASIDILPAAAITKGLKGEEIAEIGLLKEAGAAAFTDGSRSITNARVMRRAMTYARDFDALIMHHVEDPALVGDGVMNEGAFATRLGLPGFPKEAEIIMLERDIRLVALTRGRYHAAMISCVESIEIIRRAKDQGLNVTCGVSINSLTLNENDIGDYRTFLRLSPPLRTEPERLALIEAVKDGTIDVIVSDHNPQDVETKRLPFSESANGALGIETLLPAALRLWHNGAVSLARLMQALSTQPAALLRRRTGRLERGAPADLIVVDTDTAYRLDKRDLHSKSKNSPFDEARLEGKVVMTFKEGKRIV